MPDDQRADYEVGYGKPPKRTQFKKGISGNPQGRPKGTKNLKTDLLEELGETMTVRERGKERRLSKQRALVKSLIARALGGNDRATAKVLELYMRVAGIEDEARDAGVPLDEEEKAVLRALEGRFKRHAVASPTPAPEHGDQDPSETS